MRPQPIAAASTALDIALAGLKLGVGLATGSLALVGDAIHSLTDAASGAMTWWAVRQAAQPPDHNHPFGHGRAENLAAYTQGVIILFAAIGIAWEAVSRLGSHPQVTTSWAVIVLLVGFFILEAVRATALGHFGRALRSPALSALGTNKRADLASVGAVLVGLLGVHAGIPWADSAAALAVSVLIALAAGRLLWQAGGVLTDVAPEEETAQVRRLIASVEGVLGVGEVRLRASGGKTVGDARISSRRTLSVEGADALKVRVAQTLAQAMPGVELTLVADPHIDAERLVERVHASAASLESFADIHNVTVETESGGGLHISLHAKLPASMSLTQAHLQAEVLKARLRSELSELGESRIDVHLEPLEPERVEGQDVTASHSESVGLIRATAGSVPGVLGVRDVELSQRPGGTVAHLTVELDGNLSLDAAHAIESTVEKEVGGRLPELHEVIVEAIVGAGLEQSPS